MKVIKNCMTCVYAIDPYLDVDIFEVPKDYKLICAHPKKHKDIMLKKIGVDEKGIEFFEYLCGGKEIQDERAERCGLWSINQGIFDDATAGFIKL